MKIKMNIKIKLKFKKKKKKKKIENLIIKKKIIIINIDWNFV